MTRKSVVASPPQGSEGERSNWVIDTEGLPLEDLKPFSWTEVFGSDKPLRVEIGVGNSPFLMEVSRRAPDFNYVGFEYSQKRVVKFLKMVRAAGLSNIRMLRLNASLVLDGIFTPGTIDHFYINHPDPWPKRRHAKKRFVVPSNARKMQLLLRSGGALSLRTDFPTYAQQILDVLDGTEGLTNLAGRGNFALSPIESFATPYENKFRKAGRQIYYLEYAKDHEPPTR